MQVDDLLAYQVVPSVVSAVRAAGIDRLSPLQEKAVRAGALARATLGEGGRDLLVAGPGASGKTFLLDLCAVQAAHSGRRVLYVLADDERAAAGTARLRATYKRLGLRIGAGGGEPLDIAVFGAAQLTRGLVDTPSLLTAVDVVLLDELEALSDPRLGPTLELALVWLQKARSRSSRRPAVLAACVDGAGREALAACLGAELLTDERRPCELRVGVVHGGRFQYRSSRDEHDSNRRYEETLYEPPRPARTPPGAPAPAALVQLAAELCMRGEQTLVLLPDKARAVIAAEQITAALRSCAPAPARAALARLAETADGQARTLLRETLSRGVALLDPGLLPSQQALVLAACRDGEVRVLCATYPGELAGDLTSELGFRNVIVSERWTWRYQRRTRGYAREELGGLDWARLAGRAARAGLQQRVPGRLLTIAPSRYDAEVMLRGQTSAQPEPLASPLRSEPLDELVLNLLAGGLCAREAELVEVLAAAPGGPALRSPAGSTAELRTRVGTAVEALIAHDLLQRDFAAAALLRATPLGHLTARLGLPVRTVLLMSRWADAAREVDYSAIEVLLALALSPSGAQALVPLLLSEQEASDYWSRTLIRAAAQGAAERPLFRWLREQAGVVRFEQTRALKKALLLSDWAAGREGTLLENDYSLWLGAAARAAAEFARLVAALGQICELRGWDAAHLHGLTALTERLRRDPTATSTTAATSLPIEPGRDAETGAGSGASVARAVFSIRAAILAGRGTAATPAQPANLAVADHAVEPR